MIKNFKFALTKSMRTAWNVWKSSPWFIHVADFALTGVLVIFAVMSPHQWTITLATLVILVLGITMVSYRLATVLSEARTPDHTWRASDIAASAWALDDDEDYDDDQDHQWMHVTFNIHPHNYRNPNRHW